MMTYTMEQDLEKPGAAIRAGLKTVERLPSLEIDFLNHIFSTAVLAQNPVRSAKNVIEVGHRLSFESRVDR